MALLERAALLDELRLLVRAARDGHGGMVLLAGEAGMGKTALVQALADAVPGGMRHWQGACDPLEHPTPLRPLLDIARVEPPVRHLVDGSPADLGPRLVQLVREPTVLVIEDAHWMDEATGDLLTYLARRVERTRALVVVTYRDTEQRTGTLRRFLGAAGAAAGVRHRRLPPLSLRAVTRLAEGVGVDPAELYRRTGGNPFYVTEVLAEPSRSVPTSVACAVLSRADRLAPGSREFLDLTSLAPDGLEVDVAEAVLGPRRTRSALDEVSEQEMISLQGGRLHFRHELARTAVAEALPPRRRTALHARLLEALRHRPGVEPARLVHHASAVGDTAGLRRYAPAAADLAYRRGAYRTTAAHLESVLSLGEELGEVEEAGLLDLWSDCRWQLDPPERMQEHRVRAAAAWQRAGRPARQARQLVLLASAHYRCGDLTAALTTLGRARELVEDLMLDADVGCVLAGEVTAAAAFGAVPTALDAAEKAVLELEAVHAYEPLIPTLAVRATLRLLGGDLEGGLADGWRCLGLARVHAPQLVIQEVLNVVAGLLACHQATHAERLIAALGPEIEQREEPAYRSLVDLYRARIDLQRGNLGAGAGSEVLRTPFREPAVELEWATLRGRYCARTGTSDAAAVLAPAARDAAALGGRSRLWPVAAARAELAWLQGEHTRVPELTEDALETARTAAHPWATGELLHWRWRCGHDDGTPPTWVAAPWRLMLTGRWSEAAEAWEQLRAPYEQALALAAGDAAARSRALQILDRIGARPAEDRVRQDLRTAGVTSLPRRSSAAGGALTARQREVLALMAAGLTDVQIARRLSITAKTAGHHVSAVLARLRVSSRAEAVAAALRGGMLPEHEEQERTRA